MGYPSLESAKFMTGFDISTAIGLVRTLADTAKRLGEAREEVKFNEIRIHLQGIAIDLQTEIMMLQTNYQGVLNASESLKQQLVEYEDWKRNTAHYELLLVGGGGTFAYALKPEHSAGQQKHWLCTNCYERKKKSILQSVFDMGPKMKCPACGMVISPNKWPDWESKS